MFFAVVWFGTVNIPGTLAISIFSFPRILEQEPTLQNSAGCQTIMKGRFSSNLYISEDSKIEH